MRTNLGRILAREAAVPADVVVPVPDSGVCAAVGYAERSGIPLQFGLIRNHYVGRSFIEPQQSIRHFGVKVKLNPVRSILEGRRVVLIDDSIVRGTTSRKLVKMIKAAGAREVHMRISCPPTISPCFYGVDTPERSKLLAATMSEDEMRDWIGVDSLKFVSLNGLYRAAGEAAGQDQQQPGIGQRGADGPPHVPRGALVVHHVDQHFAQPPRPQRRLHQAGDVAGKPRRL